MVSMEEGEKQPPLMVMGFALRMRDASSKHTGFTRRDSVLPVVVLVGHQHMFDVVRMIEEVHGQIPMAKEELGHLAHREIHDIAIGVTAQQKAEAIVSKLRKESQPTRHRRAGDGSSCVTHL
jgi:hypothetical protein